jgi:agarase
VGANADWQLDLVENYAHNVTGRDIPLVISEFGGGLKDWQTSTTLNTYSELRDWHILKSVMGKVMGFHERPDRMAKAIPFIVGKATWFSGYETNPYPYVTYRWDGGAWVQTHLPKFFEFWKDVEGDRFPVETTDPDLQAHAFVTNTAVHLCLNNIDAFAQANADIAALLEPGMSVKSASLTRLYWDGSAPAFASMTPLATWTNLVLEPYESAILHLTLNQAPSRAVQLYQKSHYGDRTVVGYTNTPQTFTVLADMNRGEIHKATLKVGVTRSFGSTVSPIVTFNGQALPQATDWPGGTQEGVPGGAGGRDQFDGTIRIPVPAGWVQATNTVDVSFNSPGGFISTVILEASSQLPFDFSVAAQPHSAGVILSWESSSAFSYTVAKRTNLVSGSWSEVETIAGNGTALFHTNSITHPRAFFQVQANPL